MKNPVLSLAAAAARVLPDSLKRSLYHWGPLARVIRRGLNRSAPQGLTVVEVAAGGLAGMRLQLDLHAEKDYWLGTYEVALQHALGDLVQPGMIAYDVGANIGYITLLLARRVGENGKVHAFEAFPANVARLRANLELNNLQARVTVVPAAVVDGPRAVQFLVGPSGGMGKVAGSAGRQNVVYNETLDIPGIGLDEYVYGQDHPLPDVVKLDIEGGEVLALPGMRRVLADAHPLLLLELHGPDAARAAWDILKDHGYRVCQMEPGYPEVGAFAQLDWKSYLVAL